MLLEMILRPSIKRIKKGNRQKVIDKIGAKNTVGLVIYAIANKLHTLSKF